MAGYIGKSQGVTQVDGYTRSEADAEYVNDPNAALNISSSASADSATIDSSGNLLVGTTSESTWATTAGHVIRPNSSYTATRDGAQPIIANRLTSDGSIVEFRKDGTTVGSIGVTGSDLWIGKSGGTGLYFGGGRISPMSNLSPSDNTIDIGHPTDRFNDAYIGGGVYLGGTGSANYLDDYEEGTWTPTLSSTGTAPTVSSYSTRSGSYTKIGRVVVARCRIRATLSSAGTGAPIVDGLPFSNTSGYSGITNGLMNLLQNSSSTYDQSLFPQPATYGSGTDVVFYNTSFVTGSNNFIEFTAIYETTA